MRIVGTIVLLAVVWLAGVDLARAQPGDDERALRLELYEHVVRPCQKVVFDGLYKGVCTEKPPTGFGRYDSLTFPTPCVPLTFEAWLREDETRKDINELVSSYIEVIKPFDVFTALTPRSIVYKVLLEDCKQDTIIGVERLERERELKMLELELFGETGIIP